MEIFKPIDWIPNLPYKNYEVSNLGRVRRKYIDKRCGDYYYYKPKKQSSRDYYQLNFGTAKGLNKYVHVLVARAFLGEKPKGYMTDHINRDKYDNRLCNLRYITPSQNQINSDRYKLDIEEKDPIKRRKIIMKIHNNKKSKCPKCGVLMLSRSIKRHMSRKH